MSTHPRSQLANWANESDEWTRYLVEEVVSTSHPASDVVIERAYSLFRQEKAIEPRTLPETPKLSAESEVDEDAPQLSLNRLSEVKGVNALLESEVIEPNTGLTILYGENGTGKTGYSRIFKSLADSRTAVDILGNIDSDDDLPKSATVDYTLGGKPESFKWSGERGVSPFHRMSIFDSPCVTTHVDQDLTYVYVPASLALFKHVSDAIQRVGNRVDSAISQLDAGSDTILSRFPKSSTVYPVIETLGASTDLVELKSKASNDPNIGEKIDSTRQAIAALKAGVVGSRINTKKRELKVLSQAASLIEAIEPIDSESYNQKVGAIEQLNGDYKVFRSELFAAADLPAEPDETWSKFILAGDVYRQHLESNSCHDSSKCMYCRQELSDSAAMLLNKYRTFLEGKILTEIKTANAEIKKTNNMFLRLDRTELTAYLSEFEFRDDKPQFFPTLLSVQSTIDIGVKQTSAALPLAIDPDSLKVLKDAANTSIESISKDIKDMEVQQGNRAKALLEKEAELVELEAAAELTKSWHTVEAQVKNAKESDKLKLLKKSFAKLTRSLTALSKSASDQLVNQNFDDLFIEECQALRAPELQVQFVGREGKSKRRKILRGNHKPSKVLSEGEQKVLALADFLAEARLANTTAPILFDDPVSSLDHRRTDEVATRIARLSEENQVILFTHDIFFTTTLLSLVGKSTNCAYYQITDDLGKGKVTRATGPRWDTLGGLKKKVEQSIRAAHQQEGEARDALVISGYNWLRSWCEVFAETELLKGVSKRYQPNVSIDALAQINCDKIGDIIPLVVKKYHDACRSIDAHSQPLATLGTRRTLKNLEDDWKELLDCKKINERKLVAPPQPSGSPLSTVD